ncbi:MAG: sensor histidine kinase [Phycisphaerales bacterium]
MNTRRIMTWVIFWSSVALALGALAWVSVEVVALERREATSRTQASRQESIRRALWRLDSMMAPVLAIEAARPIEDYTSMQAWSDDAQTLEQLSTTGQFDTYALRYFNYDNRPQVDNELVQQLQAPIIIRKASPEERQQTDEPERASASMVSKSSKESESDFDARNRIAQIVTQNSPQRSAVPEIEPQADQAMADHQNRAGSAKKRRSDNALLADSLETTENALTAPSNGFGLNSFSRSVVNPPMPTTGSLTPRWIRADGEMRLVLVRDAIVNGQPVLQGLELDWDKLRADLLRSISDVLPDAALAPSNTSSLGAYRMATIPVALIPPPAEAIPAWSWSPARVGLVVTWIAILATIIAVGAVLRAAIVLSERRGRFVSAVTHELRTPLTTFRLYAQMLADGMVSDEQVKSEYLSTLKRESERLTGIVENVLEYARLSRVRSGKGKPSGEQSLSPGALVARFRPALARRLGQHNLDLVASLDLDDYQDRTITVDPHAVERVMMNLIENACKYAAPADDEQESEEHDTRVHLDVGVKDGMLELLVADHGPGIAPSERAKIFGEFQRGLRGLGNARSGLGLGLALSRGLAREMGGDLQLVRRRGHGAEFLLTIPLDVEAEGNRQ